ncbi:MAG: nucleoside-diphosphate sugar epimerase/dehydratase [Rhodospirillaceae bacterium]
MNEFRYLILNLSRSAKRIVMMVTDAVAITIILWIAYSMHIADWKFQLWLDHERLILFFIVPVAISVFTALGIYNVLMRAVGYRFISLVAISTLCVVLALYSLAFLTEVEIPDLMPIIFGMIQWAYLCASRLIAQRLFFWLTKGYSLQQGVLIYGAGSAGRQLFSSLERAPDLKVKGFIDDNPELQGATIAGVKIFSLFETGPLIKRESIKAILLALPTASRDQRRKIFSSLKVYPVKIKTIPTISEIVDGVEIGFLKDIDLDDLLGRDPVAQDQFLISKSVYKKSICITGGGGTIGSQIAQQCVKNGARRLIIVENSEYALYGIEQKLGELLTQEAIDCELVMVLGSVTKKGFLGKIFLDYGVETVYHAAAHKHVPLVELNPFEGVYNNSFGTQAAAMAAMDNGVKNFVLISSDKAVNPTNVMGASKRVAELILQDLAAQKGHQTIFSIVRFGNVLGSSGSVVPLFKEQIERGGPLTVTHPDITRYFMSAVEASSLVIQAGSMAKGGEVFLLDMGKPVLIKDLAELMVKLSGLSLKTPETPEGDIAIEYTGLRRGEKLFEELLIGGSALKTDHPKIYFAHEEMVSGEVLKRFFEDLEAAIETSNTEKLKKVLKMMVPGYNPQGQITKSD